MRRCKLPAYNWRWCRHNTVPLSLISSTVTASLRRPKGGRSRLGPPLNPPLSDNSNNEDARDSNTLRVPATVSGSATEECDLLPQHFHQRINVAVVTLLSLQYLLPAGFVLMGSKIMINITFSALTQLIGRRRQEGLRL